MNIDYSFIIPVFNRPQEVKELLDSFLDLQFNKPFEIVIVEDGSTISCKKIIKNYSHKLHITYLFKENTGPGDSRNYGMKKAKGNYFLILDSDCILPSHYLEKVDDFLNATFYHCFGGADASHVNFSDLQKAIGFTMTSFLTTGGIRGSKNSVTNFEPRSFNMGISKEAFLITSGFGCIHPGEDPDLSQRIVKAGYSTTFIPDAYVYHKRRISWKKFYIQVKKFGMVRPILNKWHPQAVKITYWFPSLFICFVLASICSAVLVHPLLILPFLFYLIGILVSATIKSKSLKVGLYSIIAVMIQFFGYGIAFIKSYFFIHILRKKPEVQFPELFFSK